MPEILEEVDVLSIAEKALDPEPGKTPDQVIEEELRAAGIEGEFATSREFARLYQRCCGEYSDLIGAQPTRAADSLTAAELWAAYTDGVSQQTIARSLGLRLTAFVSRSFDLGFVRARDPENGWVYKLSEGPCLGCGEPCPITDLDSTHHCTSCQESA